MSSFFTKLMATPCGTWAAEGRQWAGGGEQVGSAAEQRERQQQHCWEWLASCTAVHSGDEPALRCSVPRPRQKTHTPHFPARPPVCVRARTLRPKRPERPMR